jgi:hypothetical protein
MPLFAVTMNSRPLPLQKTAPERRVITDHQHLQSNGSHEKGKGLGEKKPERLGSVTCRVTRVYGLSGLRNDESAQCKLRSKK